MGQPNGEKFRRAGGGWVFFELCGNSDQDFCHKCGLDGNMVQDIHRLTIGGEATLEDSV